MKVRVLTLRLGPDGAFDEGPLLAFFEQNEALLVSEHFFVHDGMPTLALVVRYRERAKVEALRADVRRAAEEGAVQVAEPDRGLFEALRTWRNGRARRDGKPAYVLFTNGQLAAIARVRPRTRAMLEEIDGVGAARVRDYADEVLAVVAGVPAGAAHEEARDADEPVAGRRAQARERRKLLRVPCRSVRSATPKAPMRRGTR
jgi:ribonuclease D